jgi:DNA-binding transcriptional LysR family regulator
MRTYPAIEIDMDFSDHVVDVVEGGYDGMIVTEEVKDSRLMTPVLGTYRLIVGSPAYFARSGPPLLPADLTEHSCLHHKHPGTGKLQRGPFPASTMADDFILPVTTASSAIEPLVSLAKQGFGVACVPEFAVQHLIDAGSLVSVLGQYLEHEDVQRAVWPSGRLVCPKLKAFVGFLVHHLLSRKSAIRDPDAWIAEPESAAVATLL